MLADYVAVVVVQDGVVVDDDADGCGVVVDDAGVVVDFGEVNNANCDDVDVVGVDANAIDGSDHVVVVVVVVQDDVVVGNDLDVVVIDDAGNADDAGDDDDAVDVC